MNKVSFPMLKATNRLPSPPAVAMRVLQLVASENTTLEELSHVISADPALTAKILKYLHSPLIGLGFHGTTLAEAVARIGTRGAQLLALSFSLVSERHHQSCPSFNFNRFWSESLARAVAAKRLAASNRQWNPEEAFIAGLVFRIGQLVLATALPAEYEPVLVAAPGENDPLEIRERLALGTDHLEIGCHLLQDWKLPETIWSAMAALNTGESSVEARSDLRARAALLQLADAIAAFLARPDQQHGRRMDSLMVRAGELAGLERDAFRPLLEQISQDWITYGELLSIATTEPPDLEALELEAEEHRNNLRLAAELEVLNLRNENQQLSQRANRDRLTGLLNRGAFDDALSAGAATAAKQGAALALLMIDLDHFKSINDRHGHPAGDAVLRHVAQIFQSLTKAPAEVFRYGGEEFAVLVPAVKLDDALALAETLRQAIAHSPHLEGATTLALTVSIGVAEARWPQPALSPAALVQTADERLYEAKHAGRNTCRPHPPGS